MSEHVRQVEEVFRGQETMEGAGVRLRRLFGNQHVPKFDPFLLLDNFGSADARDYLPGFPWHPHRGIETVTYMLEGEVQHEDSLGNAGSIDSGDVQWMSAGSGILHQEMPQRTDGMLRGFQLWVNLPAKLKMETPAYRGLDAPAIPTYRTEAGATVKVVAGRSGGVEGPVRGIPVDPTYIDVSLPPGVEFEHATHPGYTSFAYVSEGQAALGPAASAPVGANRVALLGDGDRFRAKAADQGARFLFVSGRPLHEPVAWYGPIVMNTNDELGQALSELRRGEFIRTAPVEGS
jgi:hypothetical protein